MLPLLDEFLIYSASGAIFLWLLARASAQSPATGATARWAVVGLLVAPLSGRLLEVSGELFAGNEAWDQTVGIYESPSDAEWARWGGCSRRERAALRATSTGAEPRVGRCPDQGYAKAVKTQLRLRYGQAEPRATRGAALHTALAGYDAQASALGIAYGATFAGAIALLIGGWLRQARFLGEACVALAVAWVFGAGHEQARIDERALQEVAAELEPSTQALSPRPNKASPPASTGATAKANAGKAKVAKGTVTKAKATKGKATKGKATKGKATKGKATTGKATKGKATKGKATKGKAPQTP